MRKENLLLRWRGAIRVVLVFVRVAKLEEGRIEREGMRVEEGTWRCSVLAKARTGKAREGRIVRRRIML